LAKGGGSKQFSPSRHTITRGPVQPDLFPVVILLLHPPRIHLLNKADYHFSKGPVARACLPCLPVSPGPNEMQDCEGSQVGHKLCRVFGGCPFILPPVSQKQEPQLQIGNVAFDVLQSVSTAQSSSRIFDVKSPYLAFSFFLTTVSTTSDAASGHCAPMEQHMLPPRAQSNRRLHLSRPE
jgi:hypothetical protein